MNLVKNQSRLPDTGNRLKVAKEARRGRDKLEVWD